MQKERRTFGAIDDSYGKRYIIFWLYFVLNDLKGGGAYIRWYEKTFEDDIGEPLQKLCCALLLKRLGDESKAKYVLADLMLMNLFLIPKLIGEKANVPYQKYGSNRADESYANEIPEEIAGAISKEESAWMKELYDSTEFHRYRKRYLEISQELENTHGVEKRSPLVREASNLLNELKESHS